MDAKCAFHAGVTVGPDQIERMEALRRLRNRAFKKALAAEHEAIIGAIPADEQERSWREYKQRRNRADKMIRAMRNGTPVANVARYYGLTADDVMAEVKWLSENRRRRDKTVEAIPNHPRQRMSKTKRRRLRLRAKQRASREANARHAEAQATNGSRLQAQSAARSKA